MVNLLLFPFRLLGWLAVQLTRSIGLLIVQPLRLILAPMGVLSSRITLLIVIVLYVPFALRLSSPYPQGEWFTTLISYPTHAVVSGFELFIDTLTLHETDRPDLRQTQWWIAVWIVVLFAVFKMTRKNHSRLRKSLATTASQLIARQPPQLWTARPAAIIPEVMPVAAPAPSKLPKTKKPTKPKVLVHARYGLSVTASNEPLEVVADRLDPELRAFIGLE